MTETKLISPFLDACRGTSTATAPVWLMRQAGRYLPEYREVKDRYGFWTMCSTPELAAEITLQPLRRFPLDAAILFSDIMTPIPALGIDVEFAPGPVLAEPIRTSGQVSRLRVPDADEIAPFVREAIGCVRQDCSVPLIGFAGSPLTLASYLVSGGHGDNDYAEFRAWLRDEPEVAHALLDRLTTLTIDYLRGQIDAGVDAIQLFDSWAGVHTADSYATFGLPYAARVLAALADTGIARIYLAVGASHLYPLIAGLPAEVISVDWRTGLDTCRRTLPGKTLQGNLDPALLIASPDTLLAQTKAVLRAGLGGAHIFNLGHGVPRQTPPDNVARLVDAVHEFARTGES
jgi:uroporphyrinogen decarboxylase